MTDGRVLRPALVVLLFSALLVACGEAVPESKMDYVGVWRAEDMRLEIRKEGHVKFNRQWEKDGMSGSSSLDAPLQGFHGDSFIAGLGCMKTTFNVEKPPFRKDGEWRMVVDGVEFVRVAGSKRETVST